MNDQSSLRDDLKVRAATLHAIRAFFAERQVVEIDTPALSKAAATDPALTSLSADVASLGGRHYLHTSPEHAMKRLLAAGSGDIFQFARVYRDGELGRWHQPEFILLEWYRTGFDDHDLMDEIFDLLQVVLEPRYPKLARLRISYQDAFDATFGVNPLKLDRLAVQKLTRALADHKIDVPAKIDAEALLDLALATVVVDEWPRNTAVFLYDYPTAQAALARIKPAEPPVAARFEVFINGLELGNGFHELTDAVEQRRRFEADVAARRRAGLPDAPIDTDLLAALENGLPDCAGVAIGIDRLFALLIGADSLADAINLPHQ